MPSSPKTQGHRESSEQKALLSSLQFVSLDLGSKSFLFYRYLETTFAKNGFLTQACKRPKGN
jgi:hypothetical protein